MFHITPKLPTASNSNIMSGCAQIDPASWPDHFHFGFREISPRLFSFKSEDPDHDLKCAFLVEIQEVFDPGDERILETDSLTPMAICNFPPVDEYDLYDRVRGDEFLHGMLLIQFYLKVLDALITLCADKGANGLILRIPDLDVVEIYRPFIVAEMEVLMETREYTQIVVSTQIETYDDLIEAMDEIKQDFYQTLWNQQKVNPTIRQYLKSCLVAE